MANAAAAAITTAPSTTGLPALPMRFVIQHAGGKDKRRADEKIGQFADAAGGGAQQLQGVFHQLDGNAGPRPDGHGPYQGRQIGKTLIIANEGVSGTGNSKKAKR